MKMNRIWILFLIAACISCLGNEPVRLFSSAPVYTLDSSSFLQTKSSQRLFYGFSEITYLPKKWNYPSASWLILPPNTAIPQSLNRKAILLGAILSDLSYLAHYNQLSQGDYLFSYLDSLQPSFPWTQWNGKLLRSISKDPDRFLVKLNFLQADAELMGTEYQQERLNNYMRIGAFLESFFFCAHISTMKTDTLSLVYFLENQKKSIPQFIQYHEEKDTLIAKMLPGFKVIPDLLTLTQTVQVWDSLTNESHQQTFTLEQPVLDLQKYITQLRKEWILFE